MKIDYRVSAVIAWVVSVLNNFWFNRHWTFRAKQAHPVGQGIRFFAVSLVTFGFTYLVLVGLVEGAGMTKVLAQAIAVAAGTPLNFVGQKLWSFTALGGRVRNARPDRGARRRAGHPDRAARRRRGELRPRTPSPRRRPGLRCS